MADKKFFSLDLDQLWRVVARYRFTRRITEVHLHHTWRPRGSDFRGESTIRAMWKYHTQHNHWSDIAQHVSIDPAGKIWAGRPWNRAPASAEGFNGNGVAGPFMIETIGNFDLGEERLEGAQRTAVIETIAAVLQANGLKATDLRFHNEMTDKKSCPGTSLVKKDVVREVGEAMKGAKERLANARSVKLPFSTDSLVDEDVLLALHSAGTRDLVRDEGELEEETGAFPGARAAGEDRELTRGNHVSPEELAELAGHVVNLNQGHLSIAGSFRSSLGQVQSIVEVHLRNEVKRAREQNRPVRLLFYAHGGLASEKSALRHAADVLPWFRANEVFPIFFVWETGLLETLRQLTFGGQRGAMSRGALLDKVIETIGRGPGRRLWAAMKQSAAAAVEPPPPGKGAEDGGGTLVLIEALRSFLANGGLDGVTLELYAMGHSAGSNFHSWFLPNLLAALGENGPSVRDLFLLAPAITTDEFRRRLVPLLGAGIDHTTMFTMDTAHEHADRSVLRYRGSLLVLISRVLEPEPDTSILGLQESLEAEPDLRGIFGIGTASQNGEVVFSRSPEPSGPRASGAVEHGAFDDDPPTMDAAMERILGRPPAPGKGFRDLRIGGSRGASELELDRAALASFSDDSRFTALLAEDSSTGLLPPDLLASVGSPAAGVSSAPAEGGRRRALTIGVDAYPDLGDRLSGCVADARSWAGALRQLGFDVVDVLENERATRAGILRSIQALVADAQAGDVLAIHYSGHGCQVEDLDGDEREDGLDEAACPVDFRSGALLVDDDFSAVFQHLPSGVSCTVFLDCCHSGSGVRLAVARDSTPLSPTAKARFVPRSAALDRAHREFRERRGLLGRGRAPEHGPMKVVNFSACQPHEVAFEDQGQGEFTRRAIPVLTGAAGMSNARFQEEVESRFSPGFRQRPMLDCSPEARELTLLAPVAAGAVETTTVAGRKPSGDNAALGDLLRSLARLVER
ncbi:MAG: caspase family protein [Acidobacteria bacterium]|nr:caspase family protein [Acidobacteriota bacterium]